MKLCTVIFENFLPPASKLPINSAAWTQTSSVGYCTEGLNCVILEANCMMLNCMLFGFRTVHTSAVSSRLTWVRMICEVVWGCVRLCEVVWGYVQCVVFVRLCVVVWGVWGCVKLCVVFVMYTLVVQGVLWAVFKIHINDNKHVVELMKVVQWYLI